jgi:hypothetical protein
MSGTAYHIETDPLLARLRRLPVRLRIAHLAALLRHERQAIVCDLSYPSPRERERVVGREGRSEAEARVGAFSPHPPPRCSFHSHRPSPPLRGGRDQVPISRR